MSDTTVSTIPELTNDSKTAVASYLYIGSEAPGMYNALTSLGAGGLATPWYANATSAAGY
ncbi:hypothetical protein BT96DRAFT_1010745, partial [Gymnopus androsaceus JB14]